MNKSYLFLVTYVIGFYWSAIFSNRFWLVGGLMSSLYLIFVFRHVTVIMKKTHIYHRHIKGFNSHGSYFAQRPSRHPSPKIITSKDLIVTLATSRKDPSDTRRLRSSLQRFNSHASLFYTKVIQTTRRLRSFRNLLRSYLRNVYTLMTCTGIP